ncbi:MAG: Gfo/Idh/MocA family protein [Planctomycetaceae bacterium]
MAKIKIGQIGVGHAHASKLGVYRALPDDYEVVGIVEPNDQLRERAKSQPAYQDLPWMTQEQLLNVEGLQVVMVETEVRHLLDTAEVCIAAGKHVHLDKPAGENFPQYREILSAAASKHLMVQMGYMYRYSPAVVMLRDFLKRGWLGEPFEVHTVMSKVVDAGTRKRLAEYPGGMFFELACHITDLVIGILGKPEAVHPFPLHSGDFDDTLLDNMLAVCIYPNATATIKTSAMEVDGGARRHLAVCGTEGTFHIQPLDDPAVRMTLSRPQGKYPKGYQDVTLPKYERYVGDAIDMAKILRGEKEVDFSYDHDLAVQETVLRASKLPLD